MSISPEIAENKTLSYWERDRHSIDILILLLQILRYISDKEGEHYFVLLELPGRFINRQSNQLYRGEHGTTNERVSFFIVA